MVATKRDWKRLNDVPGFRPDCSDRPMMRFIVAARLCVEASARNRAGSLGVPPSLDIWVSTRATLSESWSVPTNLGNPVNSQVDDVAPWLSKDGTTLYFSSNRPGGYRARDIWYTTRAKLSD